MGKKTKKSAKDTSITGFEVGDFVGAKVKGFALWPGKIEKVEFNNKKPKYTVRFFGTNETSKCLIELKPYADITDDERFKNKKGLKEAFEECQIALESLHKVEKGDIKEEPKDDTPPSPERLTITSPVPEPKASEAVKRKRKSKVDVSEGPPTKVVKRETAQRSSRRVQRSESLPLEPSEGANLQVARKEPRSRRKIKVEIESTPIIASSNPTVSAGSGLGDDQASSISSNDKNNIDATNTIISTANTTQPKPKVSPKSEADNVMTTNTIIAKIKEKVDKKLKEKEARKKLAKAEKRLKQEICHNFKNFSSSLNRFSCILDKLTKANLATEDDILRWKETVHKYTQNILPKFAECVGLLMDNRYKITNLDGCQEFHVRLVDITQKLKEAKNNSKLPESLRQELNIFRKNMKHYKKLSEFVNENFENIKNAIIERKENGSEKETY